MGYKRFPNTCVISWMATDGYYNNTTGAYSASTLSTVSTVCNAQPQSERYAIASDGNRRKVKYAISMPLISESIDRKTAKIQIFDESFVLVNLFNYQLQTEVLC